MERPGGGVLRTGTTTLAESTQEWIGGSNTMGGKMFFWMFRPRNRTGQQQEQRREKTRRSRKVSPETGKPAVTDGAMGERTHGVSALY